MNDDQISRQKLLKKLKQHKELFCRNRIEFLGLSKNDKARADEIDNCIATVINMPPAQPEQRSFSCGQESDLISRRAAIDKLDPIFESLAIDKIKALPTALPERKRGRWMVYYECPKCGEITKDFTEYCPFCNADMRGEEDE